MLARTKRWGNSLALIIPKRTVEELKLKPKEEISFKLEKKSNVLKDLFGSIHFKKSVGQLLKDARERTSKWD